MTDSNASDRERNLLNQSRDCPECGTPGQFHVVRGLCHHREADSFPVYETWVECSSCGRKGKPVKKSYPSWYRSYQGGDDSIFKAAIVNWNDDY